MRRAQHLAVGPEGWVEGGRGSRSWVPGSGLTVGVVGARIEWFAKSYRPRSHLRGIRKRVPLLLTRHRSLP